MCPLSILLFYVGDVSSYPGCRYGTVEDLYEMDITIVYDGDGGKLVEYLFNQPYWTFAYADWVLCTSGCLFIYTLFLALQSEVVQIDVWSGY